MSCQLAFDFNTAVPVPAPIQAKRALGALGFHSGLSAEHSVARDYERRGYRIVEQRWRGGGGEIDLIAQDGDGVIFVEVKKSRSFERAANRLSGSQMRRIYASAGEYLGTLPRGQLTESRFDVALVDGQGAVQVVENAFGHI